MKSEPNDSNPGLKTTDTQGVFFKKKYEPSQPKDTGKKEEFESIPYVEESEMNTPSTR